MIINGGHSTFFICEDNLNKGAGFFGKIETNLLWHKGHEIGGHTKTHPFLTNLSEEQILYEINPAFLHDLGIDPKGIAYPNGVYDNKTTTLSSKYYSYGRTVDRDLFSLDNIDKIKYQLPSFAIFNSTSVAEIKSLIDKSAKGRKVLILVFHNIVAEPKWDTEYSIDDFQEIVEYVKIKEQENKIKVIRIKDLFE